jgi:hypothetical protein
VYAVVSFSDSSSSGIKPSVNSSLLQTDGDIVHIMCHRFIHERKESGLLVWVKECSVTSTEGKGELEMVMPLADNVVDGDDGWDCGGVEPAGVGLKDGSNLTPVNDDLAEPSLATSGIEKEPWNNLLARSLHGGRGAESTENTDCMSSGDRYPSPSESNWRNVDSKNLTSDSVKLHSLGWKGAKSFPDIGSGMVNTNPSS